MKNKNEKKLTIVNLTSHDIHETISGEVFPRNKEKIIARAIINTNLVGRANDAPIVKSTIEKIVGLPKPKKDTLYIVSSLVLNGVKDRDDCISPGPIIYDEKGNKIGCEGFRTAN